MKNIHVLPTDKPSRLSILNSGKLNFGAEFISSSNSKAVNIYITSDEEIKEGDYGLLVNEILNYNKMIELFSVTQGHKIILTTDQDLIKDGVQAIDNEFLEWFVKNQSCENVEIYNWISFSKNMRYYATKIPKEEPKQEDCCTPVGQIKRYKDCIGCDKKPKQDLEKETLEEVEQLTAVEWLFDKLNECFLKLENGKYSYTDFVNASKEVKEQAKEIEKQQHFKNIGYEDNETLDKGEGEAYRQELFNYLSDNFGATASESEMHRIERIVLSNHKQQRYSEEEVLELLIYCKTVFGGSDLGDYVSDAEVEEWFEKFKKK